MTREGQATPREELERQIMSSLVPKNEREHWAAREIESLREQLASRDAEIAELKRDIEACPKGWHHSEVVALEKERDQLREQVKMLRAHDEKLLAPYQWQPIETAPKDGTAILISNGKGAWVAKYKDVYQSGFKPNNPWLSLMLNKDHIPKRLQFGGPTHWMPLPSAEAIEKGKP